MSREPSSGRPWLPGRHLPALGIHLLGIGSALRGLTLDGPVPVGGTWGWKAAEAAAFVLGESPVARWSLFGGAFALSLLLGWGISRRPRPMRWLASVPLAVDLALAGAMGDGASAATHLGAMALLWGVPRRSWATRDAGGAGGP